ncbi:hypothetical protein GCM10027570_07960 [Streptomonospora sediminis]
MTTTGKPQMTREERAAARQSRRPSRLGDKAGAAPGPDHLLESDAGFPGLLARTWQAAASAPDTAAAVDILLTLGGHVPADIPLRALAPGEAAALHALCGRSWQAEAAGSAGAGGHPPAPAEQDDAASPAFFGEVGLAANGRIAVRLPGRAPLATEVDLVDAPRRVPWSRQALEEYRREAERARLRFDRSVADCRSWLADAGEEGRTELVERLRQAAMRTAPFVLYVQDRQYTNFRDRNNLTGKTLWPGHPDCALSNLHRLPLELWPDTDAVLVVCLALMVRSAGFARIEELNGTQATLEHVAGQLERIRTRYNGVPGGARVEPAASGTVADLAGLAERLADARRKISAEVRLYREIHGPLMHKIERIAAPPGDAARQRETALCARLREQLPLSGRTLDEFGSELARAPEWLAHPHGGFGTGLESVVHATVCAAQRAFGADFAMSRGLRPLSELVAALRAQEWARIASWELPRFFCCVVPDPGARHHFDGTYGQLADMAWSMSSRMAYNSWHFLAGNLPEVPGVAERDYFVPPTLPDVALYSDQHHVGHVAARVRFSIRSPQPVRVLDRTFTGFIDLRLLRCAGHPFGEQDLVAADRTSGFIAQATALAARLAADGADLEVTAFDTAWHRAAIAPGPVPAP